MEAVPYTAKLLNLYHTALRHNLGDLNLQQTALKKEFRPAYLAAGGILASYSEHDKKCEDLQIYLPFYIGVITGLSSPR